MIKILLVSLVLGLVIYPGSAVFADSEAGLEASSEAPWGTSSSQAQWGTSSSEATWGGWHSEAGWGGWSSAAGSQAGSESGYGGNGLGYGGYRGYRRNPRNNYGRGYGRGYSGWNYGNNSPQVSSDSASQYQSMVRLRQDQMAERAHEKQLQSEPDSDFVRTYNTGSNGGSSVQPLYRPGGPIDTYKKAQY